MRVDCLFRDCRIATMAGTAGGLGVIDDGVVMTHGARIVYVGPRHEAPQATPAATVRCDGRWVTPGLIDCHTHLVYGGDRAGEFEMRLAGASYADIARAGGGILSTVRATRSASKGDLITSALRRVDALCAEGVTTIEVKSGYGLDFETEMRQLRVAKALMRERRVSVMPTFLGAHAIPPEAAAERVGYLRDLTTVMIPFVARHRLASAVDAFCETIAFSPGEVDEVFRAARAHGLAVKLHADQLTDTGGAALAARHGALSADHLEYAADAGLEAMARSGTVAVLLPGAFYTLRETKRPPIEAMRRLGVAIAVATDSNPGSSPLTSLLLAMNMGATLFGLTVDECLLGVTRQAARALGRTDIGTLQVGNSADLAIWSVERLAELVYRLGFNPLHARVWQGQGQGL